MDFGKYIAHRGIYGGKIPENSLAAFKWAMVLGFTIELDIRLTKDCKLVVFHDKTLKRMCGIDTPIGDFTYEQLQAFHLEDSQEKIPLLSEVLKLVDGKVPLLIEIKNSAPYGVLEKRLLRLLRNYRGEYAVQSFNPCSLLWFRIHGGSIPRGQLISEFKGKSSVKEYFFRKIAAKPFVWKYISKPNFIAADLRSVSMEQIFAAFDIGADFIVWTVNNDELMENAQKFAKTIIFDNYNNLNHDFSDNWIDE